MEKDFTEYLAQKQSKEYETDRKEKKTTFHFTTIPSTLPEFSSEISLHAWNEGLGTKYVGLDFFREKEGQQLAKERRRAQWSPLPIDDVVVPNG